MVDRRYRIAVIGGDGIGPEVTDQGLKVLAAVADRGRFTVETNHYDLGGTRYLRTGEVLPHTVQVELAEHDAILLGAVGTPEVPPGVLERGLLLKLRFDFDLYVNLRPVKLIPGVPTPIAGLQPESCDMLIARENTEGAYTGSGGTIRKGTPHEIALQESINTRLGVERVTRFAFEQAVERRGHLTLCHKTNVLTYAGDLWHRTLNDLAEQYPQIATDYVHVDAMCLYMVTSPERFDVVVTDNLFGDIVTDLGAAIQGGMGLAASGNLNPDGRFPSLFEPVHGSAPDIAGRGWANPVAAVLTVAMCLTQLGEPDSAAIVEQAVANALPTIKAMGGPDMGATTEELGDRIAAAVTEV